MASIYPRDRLQPSLFDRLEDDLGSALALLTDGRTRLERLLPEPQRIALRALLEDERLLERSPRADELAPFAALDELGQDLLRRVIELERIRRQELHRTFMISTEQLRRSVLRDLQSLLNTTQAETVADAGPSPAVSFERYAQVRASALNYGIPALAGRIRTTEDFTALAAAIETSITQFEPRIRNARVRLAEADEAGRPISTPMVFIIEGELWGYPFLEQLQVRTFVDLDIGRVEVAGGAPA